MLHNDALRLLPPVHSLLERWEMDGVYEQYPRGLVVGAVRTVLDDLRSEIQSGVVSGDREELTNLALARLKGVLERQQVGMRSLVNATGIVLHTNFGRAVLPDEALDAMTKVSSGYSNLEFDLASGERGSRQAHVESLLTQLTGAESALVVNNNAGAVFLAINTLASGREVIVSRGQQVEIGGSFRIPDVIRSSGARLVEVGTTNKTRLSDYEGAVTEETALLLRVHTSNFRIVGFTDSVPLKQIVSLGRKRGLPVMDDVGSGVLVDLVRIGVHDEPTVPESVRAGADIVTFSGDKLLGGPQCGIIVGRGEFIERAARNPLARTLRIDKLSLASLEAVLRLYINGEAWDKIPTLNMLAKEVAELESEAGMLAETLRPIVSGHFAVRILDDVSEAGGGSLPGIEFPSKAVALESTGRMTVSELHLCLRRGNPAVVGRIVRDRLFLNCRTLLQGDREKIARAVARALEGFAP